MSRIVMTPRTLVEKDIVRGEIVDLRVPCSLSGVACNGCDARVWSVSDTTDAAMLAAAEKAVALGWRIGLHEDHCAACARGVR